MARPEPLPISTRNKIREALTSLEEQYRLGDKRESWDEFYRKRVRIVGETPDGEIIVILKEQEKI